jgi:hypothetical protein
MRGLTGRLDGRAGLGAASVVMARSVADGRMAPGRPGPRICGWVPWPEG